MPAAPACDKVAARDLQSTGRHPTGSKHAPSFPACHRPRRRRPRPPGPAAGRGDDDAEDHPVRRPRLARPGRVRLHHPQPRADGVRHPVRGRRGRDRAAADAGRLHDDRGRAAVDADAAPRPALPRRHARAGPRLRRQHPPLVGQRRVRPGLGRRDRRARRARRQDDPLPPQASVPPAARRARPSHQHDGGDHAGAAGQHAGHHPPGGDGRQRPVPLPGQRARARRPQPLCQVRRLRAAARHAELHRRAAHRPFRPRRVDHHPRPGHPGRGVEERRGRLCRAAADGPGRFAAHDSRDQGRGGGDRRA